MYLLEKLENITANHECPKCGGHILYTLSDKRNKCRACGVKYSPGKLKKDLKVLHYFSLEIPANKAAKDLGLSYKNVRGKYMQYRREIASFLISQFDRLTEKENYETSFFGGKESSQHGQSPGLKDRVLGLCEKDGLVFTTVADNVSAETLIEEIKKYADKGYILSADKFKSYKSLKCYCNHVTARHRKRFGNNRRHASHLEGFWSFSKERLLKYHGISRDNFYLYMKEMEFRYNFRKENLFHKMVSIHFGPVYA